MNENHVALMYLSKYLVSYRLSVTSAEIAHKSLSIHKRCMRTNAKVGY